jgi:hypothetical protein
MNSTSVAPPLCSERATDPLGEERPVRQARQRIVERLVPQLLLHAVVFQQHAGVTGKCLEEGSVVRIERRDVPQAVGDKEKSERVVVAAK